jgi:hypothetical protein
MWKDEILEDLYQIREEHAKSFNYDLQAICDDLREKQAASGRRLVSVPLTSSDQTLVPTARNRTELAELK